MGLAYEIALIALRLTDRGDIANDVVARKIIEHAKTGERDPEQLCEAVLKQWQAATPRAAAPLVRGNDLIDQLPHSSSSSRRTAGAPGFLDLSQSGDLPDL
jgi:hypothetical protein